MLILRITTLAIGLLWPFTGTAAQATASLRLAADTRLLRRAAQAASHEGSGTLLRWLRDRRLVRSATLGLDGRTIDVTFRDGVQTAVLPSTPRSARILPPPVPVAFRRTLAATGGPRAIVLDPFARNPGFDTGEAEVVDLQRAGFHVDHLVNEAVTVNVMASLSNYDVVYLDTHSGVNQWGEGVIVTGQLANADPTLAPLIKDHSVWIVGVAGDSHLYYSILSPYITTFLGTFPAHALVFFNGCSLLKSTLLWQALAAKGVGVMVSWDDEVRIQDGTAAGAAFFQVMDGEATVSEAVTALRANARGVSLANGTISQLGYVGDGAVTLREAASGSVPATSVLTASVLPRTTATPGAIARPAIDIERFLIRHRVSGRWMVSHTVRIGERVGFEVTYRTSGGGTSKAPVGTVRLTRGTRTLLTIPLHGAGGTLSARVRFQVPRLIGHRTATASLTDGRIAAHRSSPLDVRP